MDFQTVVAVVEGACRDFANPATHTSAEQTLQQFRAAPQPYDACKYILEHSKDPSSKFQAILAIRDAALREWSTSLTPQLRRDLLCFLLLQAIVVTSSDPQPLVRRQASASSAILLKRIWGETNHDERRAIMSEIDAYAVHAGTPEARRSSIDVLHAIVVEFSPLTSTPMGLPWEYHENCRHDLEESYLHGFLRHALTTAQAAATSALAGTDAGLCTSSIMLLSSLLSWEHGSTYSNASMVFRSEEDKQRPGDIDLRVHPPPAWRDVLLAEGSFSWLQYIISSTMASDAAAGSPLAVAARQVLVQLCSMSGHIFPEDELKARDVALDADGDGDGALANDDRVKLGLPAVPPSYPSGQSKATHLRHALSAALQLVTPPQEAATRAASGGSSGEAVVDGCKALLAAASVHSMNGFLAAERDTNAPNATRSIFHSRSGSGGTLINELSDLTIAMLNAGDSETAEESGNILLEMWTELVIDPCKGSVLIEDERLARAAAGAFAAAMRRELARAEASAFEDEAEYEGGEEALEESRIAGIATLGRSCCTIILPALVNQLDECVSSLQSCIGTNTDPSVTLEKLVWVLKTSGHVVADPGEGEVPLIPVAIAHCCALVNDRSKPRPATALHTTAALDTTISATASNGHANGDGYLLSQTSTHDETDPVERLSLKLLEIGALCCQHAGANATSPRLVEEVCSTLGRWADTYLLTGSLITPGLENAFGHRGNGPQICNGLMTLVNVVLMRYPGDKALHRIVCNKLLASLTRHKMGRYVVVRSPAWRELCSACSLGNPSVHALEAGVLKRLYQYLLTGGDGLGNPIEINDYVDMLLQPLAGSMQSMVNEHASILQRADRGQHALYLVQSLRGAARGSRASTQRYIYHHLESILRPLLRLLHVSMQSQPAVYASSLKLCADIVEHHGVCLSNSEQTVKLFRWSIDLVGLVSSHRATHVAGGGTSTQRLEEDAASIIALLRLLTQLMNVESAAHIEIAEAVFAGLYHIIPVITQEHLKFPKLRRAFFTLLAQCMETHAPRVANLPQQTFASITDALRFGMSITDDAETEASSFEATAALAKFHFTACRNGAPGLGPLNGPDPRGQTSLGSMLESLFKRVLIDDPSAVNYAAEAALPLLLAEPAAAERCASVVIAMDAHGWNARTAFAELGAAAGRAVELDRRSRKEFLGVFRRFVVEVRDAVKIR